MVKQATMGMRAQMLLLNFFLYPYIAQSNLCTKAAFCHLMWWSLLTRGRLKKLNMSTKKVVVINKWLLFRQHRLNRISLVVWKSNEVQSKSVKTKKIWQKGLKNLFLSKILQKMSKRVLLIPKRKFGLIN